MRAALLLGALVLSVSCGAGVGAPTAPGGSNSIDFLVAIGVSAGGSYSAALNNQTYTAGNGFQASLTAGTYEMSGSYTGGTLIIGFGSTSFLGGGVQVGSVQSLSGVTLAVQPCGVIYSDGAGTRSFRVRFTVGPNANGACR